jgi:hypothetical protein
MQLKRIKPLPTILIFSFLLLGQHEIFSQQKSDSSSQPTIPIKKSLFLDFKGSIVDSPAIVPVNEQNQQGQDQQGQANQVKDDSDKPLSPLTKSEKFKYGLKSTFLRPEGYIFTGLSTTITQLTEEDQPHKTAEDKFVDGLSRFAIKFSTRTTKTMLGSGIYPIIFKQDPRYRSAAGKPLRARILHAASRVFVTNDDEGNLEPNYSRLGGIVTASALSNLWERNTPGRDRIGMKPTFTRIGTMITFDVVQNILFREIWPDIRRKIF